MPQIIFKTHSSNEDWYGDCDYAVIELDEKLAASIIRRISLLNDLRSEDSSDLFKMTYWDSHARFFSYTDSLEELLDKVDEQELVINKEPVHIPEEALSRVECQQMLIFSDNACWQAIPGHTSIRVETASINFEQYRRYQKEFNTSIRRNIPVSRRSSKNSWEVHMPITVANILEDIKSSKYYSFTIKPPDEDQQSYYPSKRKNGKWLVVAFCFLRLIGTRKLISRLTNRLDARVIEVKKPKQ